MIEIERIVAPYFLSVLVVLEGKGQCDQEVVGHDHWLNSDGIYQ